MAAGRATPPSVGSRTTERHRVGRRAVVTGARCTHGRGHRRHVRHDRGHRLPALPRSPRLPGRRTGRVASRLPLRGTRRSGRNWQIELPASGCLRSPLPVNSPAETMPEPSPTTTHVQIANTAAAFFTACPFNYHLPRRGLATVAGRRALNALSDRKSTRFSADRARAPESPVGGAQQRVTVRLRPAPCRRPDRIRRRRPEPASARPDTPPASAPTGRPIGAGNRVAPVQQAISWPRLNIGHHTPPRPGRSPPPGAVRVGCAFVGWGYPWREGSASTRWPSAWMAKRPSSRPWSGAGVPHGHPPNSVSR